MNNTENTIRRMSYFPFEINTFSDRKLKGLVREYGVSGALVYVMLLCCVYGDERVYCTRADDGVVPDIAEYCGLSCEEVSAVIGSAADCGLFDRECYEKYGILTSRQIQQRFQEMVKPRQQRAKVDVDGKLWLLTKAETRPYIRISVGADSGRCVQENFDFGGEENNSKENEIKENKNKEKENIIKEKESGTLPTDCCYAISEYEKYIGKASPNVRRGIAELMEQGAEAELIVRLIHYACDGQKCSWRYIKAAVIGNLSAGITTAEGYDESQKTRALQRNNSEVTVKSKFNNYVDKNKPDYSDFGQKIIEEMLSECENDAENVLTAEAECSLKNGEETDR